MTSPVTISRVRPSGTPSCSTTHDVRQQAARRLFWPVEFRHPVAQQGISSGYAPLAAIVTTSEILADAITRPDVVFPHGSTADGNPVSAAAGLAVLDELPDGSVRARSEPLPARLAELTRAQVIRSREASTSWCSDVLATPSR